MNINRFDNLYLDYTQCLGVFLDSHFATAMRRSSRCPSVKVLLCNVQKVLVGMERSFVYTSLRPCELFVELFLVTIGDKKYCVELLLQLCDDWKEKYSENLERPRKPPCRVFFLPPL
jgi:hypothetical protein